MCPFNKYNLQYIAQIVVVIILVGMVVLVMVLLGTMVVVRMIKMIVIKAE